MPTLIKIKNLRALIILYFSKASYLYPFFILSPSLTRKPFFPMLVINKLSHLTEFMSTCRPEKPVRLY